MPILERAGAALYYELHGDDGAPVIVFAHGAGGNAASWWQQVPHFAERGFRALAFDHRGFGRSRAEPSALHVDRFPDDLAALLDAAGVERAALVCQSMGGWTGLPFTLAHPARVRALVLCGTPGGIWTDEVAAALAGVGQRIRDAGGLTAPGGPALGASFAARAPRSAFLYEQISSFNALSDPTPLLGQIGGVRLGADDLSGYATPTLVLAGHEDVLFPLAAMRSVASRIPGAKLVEFEATGHSTYFEEPERFNAVVEGFLAEHP